MAVRTSGSGHWLAPIEFDRGMWPGALVCRLYFGQLDSRHFGAGEIERDQVEDSATRKRISLAHRRAAS
jgi:hypothetical protein